MALNKGHFVLATTSNYMVMGALSNDLLITTGNSNQSIVFGSSNGSNMYFKISSNGFVGIGKSNPGYNLDIIGNVNFTGALTSNGVPFVSGGGLSNNGSNLFVLAPSNIGIHVATPAAPFHVGSNMRVDGSMTFFNPIQFGGLDITPGGTLTNASQLILATSNIQGYSNNVWGTASNGTQFSIMSNTVNDSWRWLSGAASNEVARLTGNGRLGLGVAAPAYPLDVLGDINFSGTLRQGGAAYVGSQWSNTGASVYLLGSNVGLGTSAPSSILHLASNAAANVMVTLCNTITGSRPILIGLSNSGEFAIATSSNHGIVFLTSNVERARVTSNGMVGIGTSNPLSALHIYNNTLDSNGVLRISQLNTGTNSNYAGLFMATDDQINSGRFKCAILATGAGAFGVPADLRFCLNAVNNSASTTAAEAKMTILNNGNVGIGTTAPAKPLEVFAGTSGSGYLDAVMLTQNIAGPNDGSTQGPAMVFKVINYNNASWNEARLRTVASPALGGQLIFETANQGAGDTTEKMRLTHAGSLGIGTTNPGVTLDVVGAIRANGSPSSIGSIALERGGTGNTAGYLSFQSATGTRLGYIGWSGTTANYLYMYNENGILGYQVGGNFIVNGALSKGSGSFDIPHPVVPGKRLLHSFIEGPRADLIYRGKAKLSAGTATVNLNRECTGNGSVMTDGTFEALCRDPEVFLQNNETWDRVRGSVVGCILTIECENADADCTVAWMVVAERKDPTMVNWDKTDENGQMVLEHDAEESGVLPP